MPSAGRGAPQTFYPADISSVLYYFSIIILYRLIASDWLSGWLPPREHAIHITHEMTNTRKHVTQEQTPAAEANGTRLQFGGCLCSHRNASTASFSPPSPPHVSRSSFRVMHMHIPHVLYTCSHRAMPHPVMFSLSKPGTFAAMLLKTHSSFPLGFPLNRRCLNRDRARASCIKLHPKPETTVPPFQRSTKQQAPGGGLQGRKVI